MTEDMGESQNQDELKKAHDAFSEWRTQKSEEIPALAERVFALRKRPYKGSGFHWSVEKDLGTVIARINDHDDYRYYSCVGSEAYFHQSTLQLLVRRLEERVALIEKSLEEQDSSC